MIDAVAGIVTIDGQDERRQAMDSGMPSSPMLRDCLGKFLVVSLNPCELWR